MRQCPNCNNNIADFVTVCPYCGAQIAAPVNAPMNPAQAPFAGVPENSGKATASMVCGILTFFCLWPAAIPAVILGHIALSEIKKSAGRLAGHGRAVAGLVMGYIGLGLLPFILIIAAIAIPNLLRSRMAANEASAVGSLRTINTAAVTYSSTYPGAGYPASLGNLGTSGTASSASADLIDSTLAGGTKRGYVFVYTGDGNTPSTGYTVTANPVTPGTTGQRGFFTDQTGVIRANRNGSADANSAPLM
jgi:type II secretory pathway pseudopilin PulG